MIHISSILVELAFRILEDPDTISYYELCNIMQNGLAYPTLLNVHYYISGNRLFDDGLRLIWNDSIIIKMLNVWYKNKVIDLYVVHEVDIHVFVKEPLFLSGPSANVSDFDNEVCGV